MRMLLGLLAALLLLAAAVVVAIDRAASSGERVVLVTTNAEGRPETDQLWIVDYQGMEWIRAGRSDKAWFERLAANPAVTLTRGGLTRERCALPVANPRIAEGVEQAFAQKYGAAARIVDLIDFAGVRVPILLRKRSGARIACPTDTVPARS